MERNYVTVSLSLCLAKLEGCVWDVLQLGDGVHEL